MSLELIILLKFLKNLMLNTSLWLRVRLFMVRIKISKEIDKTETQLSIYAATKKSNESMAHSYSNIWKIPITMFRFFTVYGPWGRPDMALFKFTKRNIG